MAPVVSVGGIASVGGVVGVGVVVVGVVVVGVVCPVPPPPVGFVFFFSVGGRSFELVFEAWVFGAADEVDPATSSVAAGVDTCVVGAG